MSDNGTYIQFTGRPAVQKVIFSKGATVNLDALAGHDLEIISVYAIATCDATVVTRNLDLKIWDGANGAGNLLQHLASINPTATQSLTDQGPIGSGGGANVYLTGVNSLMIPGGGSIKASEGNFVAGDTWFIRILYRDIPVNMFV